ncbi:MAG: hypothetical protein ABIH28_02570 [archaeon]
MEECFKCGVSGEKFKLNDAISEKGLVKVCSRCSIDGDVPVMKRKETSLENADRIAPVGGLIKEREKAFEQSKFGRKGPTPSRQDFTLRDLVEKNYKENAGNEKTSFPGITRNFNWVLLRARRNKGFGQKQLADMIGEPEIAVRMAERGILPKEYVPFIRKLERVLEIDLMENHPFRLEEHKKMLDFKESPSKEITIRDVRSMTRRKEIEMIKSKEILAKERTDNEVKKAQELLDEEIEGEKIEGAMEEKKESPGFFKRFFSKKEKVPEVEEANDSSPSVNDPSKETSKSLYPSNDQSKEVSKLNPTTPGRTRPVQKYRWQK